jgi:hypothetical protein
MPMIEASQAPAAMRDNNVARVILSSPKNYHSSDGLKSGYFFLARGDNAPRWDFVSLHSSGSNLTFESRMGFPSDLPNVVVGLQAAISRFVAEANDDAKPFTWLADPNMSIVAVRRGYQVLDSIH